MIKPLVKVNHKNIHTHFFIRAFFSALLFSVGFLINDLLDEVINENIYGKNQKIYKALAHTAILFITILIISYIFYKVFLYK